MIFQTRARKENPSTAAVFFWFFCFTCFSNSAAPDHSHLDDPAEGRVFGRGALRDRRHVVDETHFLLLLLLLLLLFSVHRFGRQVRTKQRVGSVPVGGCGSGWMKLMWRSLRLDLVTEEAAAE